MLFDLQGVEEDEHQEEWLAVEVQVVVVVLGAVVRGEGYWMKEKNQMEEAE